MVKAQLGKDTLTSLPLERRGLAARVLNSLHKTSVGWSSLNGVMSIAGMTKGTAGVVLFRLTAEGFVKKSRAQGQDVYSRTLKGTNALRRAR